MSSMAATALTPVEDWPPRVNPAEVAASNALYARRGAISFSLQGRPATLVVGPTNEPLNVDGPAFRFTIKGAEGVAHIPSELAAELLRPVGVRSAVAELDPEAAALLVEFAISGDLERLERASGTDLSILARSDAIPMPRAAKTHIRLELDGRVHELALSLGPDAMAALGKLLDRVAPPAEPIALSQIVRVCMGWSAIALADLKDLARGDVVLLESGTAMSGPVGVVADRLATRLSANGGRLVAGAPFAPLRGTKWEWTMEGATEAQRDDKLEDAEIDQLPVKLVFELGRTEMPLGDVKRVAAGTVIPLSRPLDEAVDIVANGRRIGRGSIVRIGEAVGVRVESLSQNG